MPEFRRTTVTAPGGATRAAGAVTRTTGTVIADRPKQPGSFSPSPDPTSGTPPTAPAAGVNQAQLLQAVR